MPIRPATSPARDSQRRTRLRRAGLALAGLAGLAPLAAACGGSSPGRGAAHATTTTAADSTRAGSGSPASDQSSGPRSTGSFTLAFAKCMRAHGVPGFPDPNGQAGQLGPDSGIDPGSPTFQSALNGPCRSLAPSAWLSSGSGSVGGGS